MSWQDAPAEDATPAAASVPAWANAPVEEAPAPAPVAAAPAYTQAPEDNNDQNDRALARANAQPGLLDQIASAAKSPLVDEATSVLKDIDMRKNMFPQLYEFQTRMQGILQDMSTNDEGSANPITNVQTAMDHYRTLYGSIPIADTKWSEVLPAQWKQLRDDPAGFVRSLAISTIEQPQMLLTPELGVAGKLGAQAGSLAEKAGGVAESSAAMGAQGVAQNVVQQLHDTGQVSPSQAGQAGAVLGGLGAVMGTLHVALGGAIDVGLRNADKAITPEVKTQVADQINTRMDAGQSPTDAYVATMKKYDMDPTKAEEVGTVLDQIQKGELSASDQEGQQDNLGNGEGVRGQEGEAGVLRVDQQGEDQGGGPANGPAEGPQEGAGSEAGAVDLNKPLEFSPRARDAQLKVERMRDMRQETPDADGNVKPQVYQSEYFHTTNTPELDVADPAMSSPDNLYGPAVYSSKDFGESAKHLPSRIVNGELVPDTLRPETQTLLADHSNVSNPFNADGMMPRDDAAQYMQAAGMTPDAAAKAVRPNGNEQSPVANKTVWNALKKQTGDNVGAQNALKAMGHDAVSYKNGKNIASFKETPMKSMPDREVGSPLDSKLPALNGVGADQGGAISKELLKAAGFIAGAGAITYGLTGDKEKTVMALAAAGALVAAVGITARVRAGASAASKAFDADRVVGREIFRTNNAQRAVAILETENWRRTTSALLKGEPSLAASHIRVRDWLQGHTDMGPLSPREQAYANEVRKFLVTMGQRGMDEKVLRSTMEDYLPGLYQMKPFESVSNFMDALTQNGIFRRADQTGMSPATRFSMKKIFPDYRAAETANAAGNFKAVALTNDPARIAALYAHSLNKTLANKALLDTLMKAPAQRVDVNGLPLKNTKGDVVKTPLVVGDTPAATAARIYQGNAIKADQLGIDRTTPDGKATVDAWNAFDIQNAPRDYIPINHPVMEGLKVHQAIEAPMKMMFDTHPSTVPTKALGAVSSAAKTLLFTGSTMHMGSILQVAAPLLITHPIGMTKALIDAHKGLWDLNSFEANGLRDKVNEYAAAGLTIQHGAVEDANPGILVNTLNLFGKWAGTYDPMIDRFQQALQQHNLGQIGKLGDTLKLSKDFEAAAATIQAINHFTFDYLIPTAKVGTAMFADARNDALQAKGKGVDRPTALRQIATSVNDLYGGQNWFNLVNDIDSNVGRSVAGAIFSPVGRRWQQILALAPDWNVSAIRAWTQALKSITPGVEPKASDFLYQTYITAGILMSLGAMNMVQRQFTGEDLWDKDNWTQIDTGDGTHMTPFKHLFEGVHALSNPQGWAMGKFGYIPSELMDQIGGHEYTTSLPPFPNAKDQSRYYGPPMGDPSLPGRILHAVTHFGVPIVAENAVQNNMTPMRVAGQAVSAPVQGKTYAEREQAASDKATAEGKNPARAVAFQKKLEVQDEAQRQANRDKRAARGF